MRTILSRALAELNAHRSVVLVTIVAEQGSAPRGPGSQMLVGADGQLTGTIGGGQVERQSELLALSLLKEQRSQIQHFALTQAGADSLGLLREVTALLRRRGFAVVNVDAALIAQRPKIAPYRRQMEENLAAAMGIGVALSALPVLLYQGLIALLASVIEPYLTAAVILEMKCVGSILIVGLSLNMLGLTKLKVMNYVPAVFLPVLLSRFL